jgi:L-alanine-DL-glutamate epimerase-like enolase superfamily enzyme
MPHVLTLSARIERWPLKAAFTISRGSKTEAVMVTAHITDGTHTGRGEAVPYARYGETRDGVLAAVISMQEPLQNGLSRAGLQQALPPGAARNAIDCALWDLAAKQQNTRTYTLAGLPPPQPIMTCTTISLAEPALMAASAAKILSESPHPKPVLKLKLGAEGDIDRLGAIRRAVPDAVLIADANEGWRAENLAANLKACADHGLKLIEQPLPAAADEALLTIPHPIPICADESAHDAASLPRLRDKYDAVNIKLDKTGGLTEALATLRAAKEMGFQIMAGCMVSTSLAIAPMLLLTGGADFVDLDGALLLAQDRPEAGAKDGYRLHPPPPALWG